MEIHEKQMRKAIVVGGLLLSSLVLVFAVIGLLNSSVVSANAVPGGADPVWTPVFTETFESGISAEWTVIDGDAVVNGDYHWMTTTYTASQGTTSVWATGGGLNGSGLQAGEDDYPNGANSLMTRGPVDLSEPDSARLRFDYWLQTEPEVDVLQVMASTDGLTFTSVMTLSGNSDGWQNEVVNLDDYVGEEEVWVRFFFGSDEANTDLGAFVDDIALEVMSENLLYLPFLRKDPTPLPTSTPTPTNTPTATSTPSPTPTATTAPVYYFDDFSDPNSGWPVVDNTHVSNDCYKWYYDAGVYKSDICDDRTDVKASPLVNLPNGDYTIEVDARFRHNGGWWTSYGILFDAKDDPNPDSADLGDYYLLWVLWEGSGGHRWKILRDETNNVQVNVTPWQLLPSSVYNYGDDGLAWNTWRIDRTENRIKIYVNGHLLADLGEGRPRTNQQVLFGIYTSTYETNIMAASFDNYLVDHLGGGTGVWQGQAQPFYSSGEFKFEEMLPSDER